MDQLTGNTPWTWGKEEQDAFDEIKQRFCSSPVLTIYDPDRKTRIKVDASGFATGTVLSTAVGWDSHIKAKVALCKSMYCRKH